MTSDTIRTALRFGVVLMGASTIGGQSDIDAFECHQGHGCAEFSGSDECYITGGTEGLACYISSNWECFEEAGSCQS